MVSIIGWKEGGIFVIYDWDGHNIRPRGEISSSKLISNNDGEIILVVGRVDNTLFF